MHSTSQTGRCTQRLTDQARAHSLTMRYRDSRVPESCLTAPRVMRRPEEWYLAGAQLPAKLSV